MRHGSTVAVGVAVLALASASSDANAVTITNPSFEDPVLADGTIAGSDGPITGWSVFVTGAIALGDIDWAVWNPPAAAFDGPLPDGDNVALVFLPDAVGDGEVVLAQTTATPLEAGLRYDLVAQVGDLSATFASLYDGFPGARIELRAGGDLLASATNGPSFEGSFSEIAIAYVAPSGIGSVGEPLAVHLVDANEFAGGGLAWDLVSLTTTAVEAYEFAMADADGSVSGVFSYVAEATSQSHIPATATMRITHATGDLAGFAAIDWTSGTVAAYEGGGQYYLSIGALGSEDSIEFAIEQPFDLSGPLPLEAFSDAESNAYLAETQVFDGGDLGANVSLTAVPEPGHASLALAAAVALLIRARARAAA